MKDFFRFLVVVIFITVEIGIVYWWWGSGTDFFYTAVPLPTEKTVSVGGGHGNIFLAFGKPLETRFIGEPVHGGADDLEGYTTGLTPEDRIRMATEQFHIKIAGTTHAANYPVLRLPLVGLLVLAFSFLTPLIWLRRT